MREVRDEASSGVCRATLWKVCLAKGEAEVTVGNQDDDAGCSFHTLYRRRQQQRTASSGTVGPINLDAREDPAMRAAWVGCRGGSLLHYPASWEFGDAAGDFVRVYQAAQRL